MQTAVRTQPTSTSTARVIGRWMTSFAGFPLGGLAAKVIAGPIDATTAALVGGAISGAVLGAAQSVGHGPRRTRHPHLGRGHRARVHARSDHRRDRRRLRHRRHVTRGAGRHLRACRRRRPGAGARTAGRTAGDPLAAALAAIWALGWAVTTAVGIQVDEQFTVFGSSGAIVVTALTAVLPVSRSAATPGRAS